MLCIYGSVLDELWRRSDADLCWGAKSLWFHALSSVLLRVMIGGSGCFPVMGLVGFQPCSCLWSDADVV